MSQARDQTPSSAPAATRRVAVLGAADRLGGAILAEFAASHPDWPRLAVDPCVPAVAPPLTEVYTTDVRDRMLPLILRDVDVVVHAPAVDVAHATADADYGRTVRGTHNVLRAAAEAGVGHVVVITSSAVYGAYPDRVDALPETTPLRANPGMPTAVHQQLLEEVVTAWAADHPSVTVTRLRTAPLPGVATVGALTDRLLAPRIVDPLDTTVRWQFAAAGDVATAVELVVRRRLAGVFNVASSDALSTESVAQIMDRRLLRVRTATLEGWWARARALGVPGSETDLLPFLHWPAVVDTSALTAAGWTARQTSAEVLADFAAEHRDVIGVGPWRLGRRGLHQVRVGLLGLLALAGWRMIRG